MDGLTATAKNRYVDGLKEAGADVEEIHLNKMNLEHCWACGNGWGSCRMNGSCFIKDDFTSIYQDIAKADNMGVLI